MASELLEGVRNLTVPTNKQSISQVISKSVDQKENLRTMVIDITSRRFSALVF